MIIPQVGLENIVRPADGYGKVVKVVERVRWNAGLFFFENHRTTPVVDLAMARYNGISTRVFNNRV